jgi:hypothetical protein
VAGSGAWCRIVDRDTTASASARAQAATAEILASAVVEIRSFSVHSSSLASLVWIETRELER